MLSTAKPNEHVVHSGIQCDPPHEWETFEWEEPNHGKQTFGEITFARRFGTSGNISSGFWRVAPTSPGVQFDAKSKKARMLYSSPMGDETAVVIDGTANITVRSTGQKYSIGPGSIISTPMGLETEWAIDAPYFKTFWVIWRGAVSNANAPTNLKMNHINDNPSEWTPYSRSDAKGGELVSGELYMIRDTGSTGSLKSGIWRAGRGIPSTNVEPDGRMVNPYIGATGDETMLLLEGEVEIIEKDSGKKHLFRAGDSFGLTSGMHVTWVSRAPFTRKLWVITRDEQANDFHSRFYNGS